MDNLIVLVASFFAGILLRQFGKLPDESAATINGFIINISLPALIILHVHRAPMEIKMFSAIAAPWIFIGLGILFLIPIGRFLRWDRPTIGGVVLTGSMANTSFVGLPMIEAFYGVAFLSVGLLMDQLGTYLVLSTVGILIASYCAHSESMTSQRVTAKRIVQKILFFRPFQALVVALLLRPIEFPTPLEGGLERLGATLAPLALFSVGYQLRLGDLDGRLLPLAIGLAFQLLVGPLLVGFILMIGASKSDAITQVTIFEIAMPPQIGAAIVAIDHKLNPKLVNLMVGIGIPLSFITLPIWWYMLKNI